jgi:hypothetical protein
MKGVAADSSGAGGCMIGAAGGSTGLGVIVAGSGVAVASTITVGVGVRMLEGG